MAPDGVSREAMSRRPIDSMPAALAALVLALAACAFPCGARAASQPPILADVRDVIIAVGRANAVTLSAYTLSPRGKMSAALLAAAARGAHVSVALDGGAFGAAARSNARTIAEFGKRGIRVHLTERPLHLKAAVVDGTVFLSDRNWTSGRGHEVVIRDPYPGDRPIVERAILGETGSNGHLWLRKAGALAAEARLVTQRASHEVFVESESFGAGTPLYDALVARARARDAVHLIVASFEYRRSTAEQRAIAELARDGVSVRIGTSGEKLAIDGSNAWIGSANATRGLPNQVDFGFIFHNREIAAQLRAQYDANWNQATPL
jgi:phosphatidylserine/phosphatidylglycerophosphate/cardiolipin synthase-like enzyme